MTFKFNNVYINDAVTVAGPYEKKGPLGKYFNYTYKDLYCGASSFEEAEVNMIKKGFSLLNKTADLFISGDLLNQIVASSYAASIIKLPFIGIYNACATSVLGLIIGSCLVDNNMVNNVITSASSHNNSSEKQFRYPVEYGAPKKKTTTFTCTGAGLAYISKEKSPIKVECGTIGSVVDMGIKDVYNMGAVMAPAAAKVIYDHLTDTNRSIDYYDLIVTGDLGIYGKNILKECLIKDYDLYLNNYDDCGVMIYDLDNQPVYAGASGAGCLPLVSYSYIFDEMKKGKYKKVLLVATGALHSPTMVNLKLSIPAIAHAISLEVL